MYDPTQPPPSPRQVNPFVMTQFQQHPQQPNAVLSHNGKEEENTVVGRHSVPSCILPSTFDTGVNNKSVEHYSQIHSHETDKFSLSKTKLPYTQQGFLHGLGLTKTVSHGTRSADHILKERNSPAQDDYHMHNNNNNHLKTIPIPNSEAPSRHMRTVNDGIHDLDKDSSNEQQMDNGDDNGDSDCGFAEKPVSFLNELPKRDLKLLTETKRDQLYSFPSQVPLMNYSRLFLSQPPHSSSDLK